MRIVVVYGIAHKGCTYHMVQQVLAHFSNAQVTEFVLPRALPAFCTGCCRCFSPDGQDGGCPHTAYTAPLRRALVEADFLVLTSPVYAGHVSGQMKAFLDHFANMWMVHRPEPSMFSKQGLVVAAAAGPVYKKTLHEMKDSLDFWGVARTYKLGFAVYETRWEHIAPRLRRKIARKAGRTARLVQARHGRVSPALRVRWWFFLSRLMQKHVHGNPADAAYWQAQGWLGRVRPWRREQTGQQMENGE